MARGRVASINVSDGGVPKIPIGRAGIAASGVEGDRQRDLRYHGGVDRAVSLYSLEHIEALAREGHPVGIGTTGENLTVSGLDWGAVVPGVELAVGPVRLRITSYAAPCETIAASFADGHVARISEKIHPGWSRLYARVVAGGLVRVGDEVAVVEPCGPEVR